MPGNLTPAGWQCKATANLHSQQAKKRQPYGRRFYFYCSPAKQVPLIGFPCSGLYLCPFVFF